jgi:hypothetical protein
VTAPPAWGEDWLRSRAHELWTHLQGAPAHPGPPTTGLAALLEGHHTAHRVEGSEAVDPKRARQRLEDAFTRLNPDFGVIPEHSDPRQHDLAYRREQAMTLGLRVLVALREENVGPSVRRTDAIGQRRREGFDRTGGSSVRRQVAREREVDQ